MTTTEQERVRLHLPWPAKALSPNARVHWAAKARAVKEARRDASWLTLEAIGRRKLGWQDVRLEVEFCPPSRRRVDLDNAVSSGKALFDGIADALGIDDSRFVPTYRFGDPVKGGEVRVTLEPL